LDDYQGLGFDICAGRKEERAQGVKYLLVAQDLRFDYVRGGLDENRAMGR